MSEYEYVWGGCYICGQVEKEEYRTHAVLNNELIYVCAEPQCHTDADEQGILQSPLVQY